MDQPTVAFGHVALITADLDRFRRFYEDVFGLRAVEVDHPDGMPFRRLASFTDAGGDVVRMLVFEVPAYTSGLPDDVIGRRGRLDHIAFHVDARNDFDAVTNRLVERGASSGVVSELGPVFSVLFVDPDGGHHNLQTLNHAWTPGPSTEIPDPALWRRLRAPV
jgi:glyoxylase I family protein